MDSTQTSEVTLSPEPDRWGEDRLAADATQEEMSPSERYRLVIRYYNQGNGYWQYSRGTIYRVSDGAEIADVKRNYSTFHHSFITKNGEEYLISGRSYMGQTIVNLDTGIELNDQWKTKGYKGSEFCWAESYLSPDGNTLVVNGCVWGGPYEYRFYDFTNPMTHGWPELTILGRNGEPTSLDANQPPAFQGDMITCTETVRVFKPTGQCEDVIDQLPIEWTAAYDDDNNWMDAPDFITTLRRLQGSVSILDRWESAELKAERAQQAQLRKEKIQDIKNTSRYKRACALVKRFDLEGQPDQMVRVVSWNNWEVLFIMCRKGAKERIELSWTEGSAPIEVRNYDATGRNAETTFPNDDPGFDEALQCVEAALLKQ